MSAGFSTKLVPVKEAELIRDEIMKNMPAYVRARVSSCMRKEKAFQIAAADYYMRKMAAEEGLGEAELLRIMHESSGKPYIAMNGKRIDKCISVSHSDGYIFLCMADDPIGCDVERIRVLPVNDGLKGFFSEADMAAIKAAERPEEMLTRIWTRREAFAKLTGIMEGLKKWSFCDKAAIRQEMSIVFTEGRERDYLFTAAKRQA